MANSVGLHEPEQRMRAETIDAHRALTSMMEELEAVDWYGQRVDAADDPELKAILAHNRGEEIEHFVMTLEWLRRRDAKFSTELESRLFTTGSIVAQEAAKEGGSSAESGAAVARGGSLGIGSLKGGATL
jgi:ferritin-like protein